ncbi:hypothetical protein [Mesorhizobium sp. f-mel]
MHGEVEGKLNCGFEDRGSRSVKNIARPVRTYLVQREEPAAARSIRGAALQQEIEYCRAPDGARLAWAKVGTGPPIDGDEAGGECDEATPISASLKHPLLERVEWLQPNVRLCANVPPRLFTRMSAFGCG